MKMLERLTQRGWLSFFREIAIIAIGVLLALAAGELADDWSWQRRVAEGELRLRSEAAYNFNYFAEQVIVGPCVDRQLLDLRKRLLASGPVLDVAPEYNEDDNYYVYRMPSRPFVTTAWDALKDDGTSVHMADDRLRGYAAVYTQIEDMRARRTASAILILRARVLANPIPLDSGTRAQLLGELLEQAGQSRSQSRVALQVMGRLRDLGQAPAAKDIESFLPNSGTIKFCKAHGLPLVDWRQKLAEIPVTTGK